MSKRVGIRDFQRSMYSHIKELPVTVTKSEKPVFEVTEIKDTKVCSKCVTEKPVSDFNFKSRLSIFRESWCKECVKEQAKIRYAKLQNS